MTEAEKRLHRCCFTGHRPEKLNATEWLVKQQLEKEIRRAIDDGLDVFISGMARGVDIWAAEIVLELRDSGTPIRLMCASPYDGFEKSWNEEWQERYRRIINAADYALFVCSAYNQSCFQIRNEWMVNHSVRVIAVFNGEKGGTQNTIKYAEKLGIPVVSIRG